VVAIRAPRSMRLEQPIDMLWLRTLLFTLLVPGTVLGLVPWIMLTKGSGARYDLGAARFLGGVLILPGAAIILRCFLDFIRRGRGTPAPYDPPRRLVIAGLYRYVRNPQYIGVFLVVLGEAIWFGNALLFAYAGFLAIAYHLFVRLYEEPTLGRMFGEDYVRYCDAVPRWLPKRPDAHEG
jgi:protein-S-isoprenylcysteine O-methyltransferase Ste14